MPTPPKQEPVRGHRGRGITKLPSEGRKGDPPPWPLPTPMSGDEDEAWRTAWATPQAVAWEKLGWTRTVARYCRLLVIAESENKAALHAQVTAIEDRLGLTPKAMRLLLWEIVGDDLAEKRQEASAKSARRRFKAVD